MKSIYINLPVIEQNKITFSWSPGLGFKKTSFTVEYPTLDYIDASPGKLTEAYLPLCIILSALGEVIIHLPVNLPSCVLCRWTEIIDTAAKNLFKKPSVHVIFDSDPSVKPHYRPCGSHTVLFFGGGTESLLTLCQLINEGTVPYLASFGGTNWPGSNPAENPDKFVLDKKVSKEFALELVSIRTNFREIFDLNFWKPYLKEGVSLMNAVVSLPAFIGFMLPVVEQLGINRLVNGNEKMNFPMEYFCFSPAMTDLLDTASYQVAYESRLGHLYKEDVCKELYEKYPQAAAFQYSCWRNKNIRWCYKCQSCLEYYMFLVNSGVDPSIVGLEPGKVRANLKRLIWAVAKSPESRPGEIWHRMRFYPALRKNTFTKKVLDDIYWKSVLYHKLLHHFYDIFPEDVIKIYWSFKSYLKKLYLKVNPAPIKESHDSISLTALETVRSQAQTR